MRVAKFLAIVGSTTGNIIQFDYDAGQEFEIVRRKGLDLSFESKLLTKNPRTAPNRTRRTVRSLHINYSPKKAEKEFGHCRLFGRTRQQNRNTWQWAESSEFLDEKRRWTRWSWNGRSSLRKATQYDWVHDRLYFNNDILKSKRPRHSKLWLLVPSRQVSFKNSRLVAISEGICSFKFLITN